MNTGKSDFSDRESEDNTVFCQIYCKDASRLYMQHCLLWFNHWIINSTSSIKT